MTDTRKPLREVAAGQTVRAAVPGGTATTKTVARVLLHPTESRLVYTDGTSDYFPDGTAPVTVVT